MSPHALADLADIMPGASCGVRGLVCKGKHYWNSAYKGIDRMCTRTVRAFNIRPGHPDVNTGVLQNIKHKRQLSYQGNAGNAVAHGATSRCHRRRGGTCAAVAVLRLHGSICTCARVCVCTGSTNLQRFRKTHAHARSIVARLALPRRPPFACELF